MHIAYKLLFEQIVTQVHKTPQSEEPLPSLLALGASDFSHPAQPWSWLSTLCATHPYYPPPPLSQLVLSLSAVIFILLGFV